jgi:BT1 family
LWATYDHAVLILISLNALNNGALSMLLMIVVNMYQDVFLLSPTDAQLQVSIIGIPTCFVLFYGILSETVPIFNSRKKSYLILMSLFEVVMATVVSLRIPDPNNPIGTTFLLTLVTFSMAFIDTICDGLLVIAQRNDPQHGSEDLQVLAWGCQAIGGVIPSGLSIILNRRFTLQTAYIIPAVVGLLIFGASLKITKEIEQDNAKYMALTFKQRVAYTFRSMKQALKLDALRKMMIFFLIFLLIMPNFKDYLDYFYNFSIGWDATLEIIVSTGVLLSTVIYAFFLEEVEIRRIAGVAILFYLANTILNMLLVTHVIRMNTFTFVSI